MLSEVISTTERWAPVPGFEGAYEVSDMGRVRSVRTGKLRRFFERSPIPYQAVFLRIGDKQKCFLAHSLVLEAFKGARPEGTLGRHLDGDARNNSLLNLEWGTPLENSEDQRRHGRTSAGEKNCKAKLTADAVALIRASRLPNTHLAKSFGVTAKTISNAKRGLTWAAT